MSQLITWESWILAEEADRRFRRILLIVAIPAILLALLFTLWQLATPKTEPPAYAGTQTVELLAEQQQGEVAPPEQPKPAPENKREKPQEAPKQQVKPVPQPVPQPTAREKAQKEINKAFDQLNDLRDQNLSALNNQVLNTTTPTLSSRGGIGGGGAEAIANSAAANSGGGIGGTGSYTSTQSGTGLGTRRTGTVSSNIGFGRDVSKAGANGKVDNGRTILQVQEVFDRNQASFYSIYNRAARADPSIADGRIVVHFVIQPDGSVTNLSLVSSTFNNPDFEGKVMQRIKLLNFGAKEVAPFDVPHYPIDFRPM